MKTYFVSDTHGFRQAWCWLFEELGLTDWEGNWLGSDDRVIHVGDHVDRGEDSVGLYRLMKKWPNIVRLLGNHDIQYIGGPNCGMETKVREELTEEMKLDILNGDLKAAHVFNDEWLCVHGGLHNRWVKDEYKDFTTQEIADDLNTKLVDMVANGNHHNVLDIPGISRGGRTSKPGITWCDVEWDLMPGLQHIKHKQIVGHRPQQLINSKKDKIWAINVPYETAQALIYNHETDEWSTSQHVG